MIRAEVNQQLLKGGQRLARALVARTLRAVAKVVGEKRSVGVSIAFVTKAQMRVLNKQYRGKDSITDVLSFALDEDGELGELILSYDQAKVQAKEMQHATRHELVFLITHGLLHLYGHDHEKPKDAKKMFALQTQILNKMGVNPKI